MAKQGQADRFHQGTMTDGWRWFGAHPAKKRGRDGWTFRVWAPHAEAVSVVGDFNDWEEGAAPLARKGEIWEGFLPDLPVYTSYKYAVRGADGQVRQKADPYGFHTETRPATASKLYDISGFKWTDGAFREKKAKHPVYTSPLNIYEVHLGSWKKRGNGDFIDYKDLAKDLAAYVKDMGYTAIELLPVTEHPLDDSWGYQCTGYFAPTSRFGTPKDFMWFVNHMHKNGILVLLDWVPSHFCKDAQGLYEFDGTYCYEYSDPNKREHAAWGTRVFDYGRPEVKSFLFSSARFWLEEYHIDGLRVDAVASMLYLDYGKNDGEWVANIYGGNQNLEAMEFLKHVNSMIHKRGKGALSIAEESTAWPKVTGSLDEDGLGFDMKWNMGWMNDFLSYIRQDPYFRSGCHNELTFSMVYAYSERFMLVLSHDEVVHGKASMIGKMPGNRQEQFENLKASYGFMMCHPGKKLLFMGQDIGEYDEWNEDRSVEWELLENADHKGLSEFVKALNHLYCKQPALYKKDTSWDGFEWINCINANDCILSFVRKADKPEEMLLIVLNFANVERKNFQVGVPFNGKYKEILNSDAKAFGGEGRVNPRVKTALEEPFDGREYSIKITQAPLGISIFSYQPYTKEELKEIAKKKAEKEKKAREAARKKKGAKKAAAKTLKEELAEKVFEVDEVIAEKGEVEKPVKVVKSRRKADGQ